MPFLIKPNQKLTFIGDSVTDCGRRASAAPLGEGYVRYTNDLILAKYPGRNIQITNLGIGGNTTRDLYNRWADDLLSRQSDWISIAIGINDANRATFKSEPGITFESFVDYYTRLLEWTAKSSKARLIIVDPFYISRDSTSTSNRALVLAELPKYLAVTKKLAKTYNAIHIKTHDIFQSHLDHIPAEQLAPDAVHPTPRGHLLYAYAWLAAMGY